MVHSEMAMSFVGLVRWSLDLFIYLLQEIFRIYYAIKHKEREGQTGLEKDQDWIHNYSMLIISVLTKLTNTHL